MVEAQEANFAETIRPNWRRLPVWPERFGMANEDVYRCHVALSIPTNPQFGSLNLGAAVQVIATNGARPWGLNAPSPAERRRPGRRRQVAGMLAHWEQALAAIGFLDPAAPKKLMPRLEPDVQPRTTHAGGNPYPARCRQIHAAGRTAKRLDFKALLSPPQPFMLARLQSDIQCIPDRDPAARSRFEVVTCYPGLHAIWLHLPAHWCWTHGFKWLGASSRTWRWFTGIEIHPGAVIGERVFIDHGMGVVIGETAVVGDGCTIYHGVTLGGTSLLTGRQAPPHAGARCGGGAGAKVLGGFEVGEGQNRQQRRGHQARARRRHGCGHTGAHHPVQEGQSADVTEPHGQEEAKFSAYGVTAQQDDPHPGDARPDRQRRRSGAPDRAALAGHGSRRPRPGPGLRARRRRAQRAFPAAKLNDIIGK